MSKWICFFVFFILSLVLNDSFSPIAHAETILVSPDQINITDLTFGNNKAAADLPLILAQNEGSRASSGKKSASRRSSSTPEGFGISSVSLNLGLETSPCCGFNTGYGLGAGADFFHLQDNIYLRADLNYKTWSQSVSGIGVSYTRIPLIVSGRIYFPMDEKTRLYAQGGMGLSFDNSSAVVCVPGNCFSGSASDTRIDLAGGAGFQALISPGVYLGAEADLHIVTDSYFSLMGTLSFALDR